MVIPDLHYGVRNDLRAFFEHQEKFNKDMFDIIRDLDIKHIFHTGDLFDRRKYLNFSTLKKTKETFLDPMAELCKEGDRKFYLVPGNHDTYFRNTLEINSLELTLQEYDFNLFMKPTEVTVGDKTILMLPWICDENHTETLKAIADTKAQYCFGHLELAGFEMQKGNVSLVGDDPALFEKFDMVLTGHFHHRSHRGNINYIGSAYEFTWADYNDPKGCVILDLDNGEIDYVNNPYKIFHVYDYNDEIASADIERNIDENIFAKYANCFVKIRVHKKTNIYLFDKLVDKIQSNNPAKLNIIEMSNLLNMENIEMDIDQVEDTPTLIRRYVESLNIESKTDPVKSLMASLYQEAITLENVE